MGKPLSTFGGGHGSGKIRAVRPTTNRQKDLEVAVALLVEVQLFETSVEIVASVVPRVRRPVLVGVRPAVGQEDLASVILDVGKSVQHMCELVGWDLLRLMVAAIDGPVLFDCQLLTNGQCADDGIFL